MRRPPPSRWAHLPRGPRPLRPGTVAALLVIGVGLAAAGVELYAWWTIAHTPGSPPAWALWVLLATPPLWVLLLLMSRR